MKGDRSHYFPVSLSHKIYIVTVELDVKLRASFCDITILHLESFKAENLSR